MENSDALSKLRPGMPKCYTYSEPEDSDSDEMDPSKDGKIKPKAKVTKRIRKKRGRKKRYHPIIDNIRKELIDAVSNKGEKIKEAAERLQINYSSAKSIFQVFKKEGRLNRKVLIRKTIPETQDSTSTKVTDEVKTPSSIQIDSTETPVIEAQKAKITELSPSSGQSEKKQRDNMLSQPQSEDYLQYMQNNFNGQFFHSSFANQRLMDNTIPQNVMGKPINMPRYPMMNVPTSFGISPNMYPIGIQDFKNRSQPGLNPNIYFSNYQQSQNWNWSKPSPNSFIAPYYNPVSNPAANGFYGQNDHRTPNFFLLNNNSYDTSQVLLKEEFDGVKTEHTGFSTKVENSMI